MNSEVKTRFYSVLEKTFDARTAAANIEDSATLAEVAAKVNAAKAEIVTKRNAMNNAVKDMVLYVNETFANELRSCINVFASGAIQVINAAEENAKQAAAVNELANLTF